MAKPKPTAERKLEDRPIETLIPYARNARTHSDAQVAQIAASIREFGWTNPVLVDGANGIIAGHGRVLAARKLGLEAVPCIELGHLSETQRRAYILADNKLAEQAGWDVELLKLELQELRAEDFDVGLAGFDAHELAALLEPEAAAGLTDEDASAQPRAQAVSVRADLWVLGNHRLMCGDSTQIADVDRLMAGKRAVLMATDPPYGVSHVATKNGIPRSGFSDMAERWEHIKNDDLEDEKLQAFLEEVFRTAVAGALSESAAWYLWHAHLTQGFFAAAAADVLLHRQIIWKKPGFVLTRSGMYHWAHEPCFFGWRKGFQPPWYGEKNQSSVWELGRDQDRVHPTQKPIALWEAPIKNHTRAGEVIYEPFAGSGSQLIAAEKHGRACYALELAEHYVDAIIRRWQDFTGKKATLEADGRSFDEMVASRKSAEAA